MGVLLLTSSVAFGFLLSSVVVSQPRKVWLPEVAQLDPSVLYEASEIGYSHPSDVSPVRRTTNFVAMSCRWPACDQVWPPSFECDCVQLWPPSVEYSMPTDEHGPEASAWAGVMVRSGAAMAIPAAASAGSVLRRDRCTERCSLGTW